MIAATATVKKSAAQQSGFTWSVSRCLTHSMAYINVQSSIWLALTEQGRSSATLLAARRKTYCSEFTQRQRFAIERMNCVGQP